MSAYLSMSMPRSPSRPAHCERMDDRRHPAPHLVVGLDGETAGAHQLECRPVADASAGKAAPGAEEFVLTGGEEPGARADVFDEQQLPLGAQDACDLAKCEFRFVDGAEDE